jgi:prepilin-type N-terminal cleavage/methylation domain-containing protein
MKYNKKQNGFSLLELLIVILVILILATISAVAVNSQKAKARDAKRIRYQGNSDGFGIL